MKITESEINDCSEISFKEKLREEKKNIENFMTYTKAI